MLARQRVQLVLVQQQAGLGTAPEQVQLQPQVLPLPLRAQVAPLRPQAAPALRWARRPRRVGVTATRRVLGASLAREKRALALRQLAARSAPLPVLSPLQVALVVHRQEGRRELEKLRSIPWASRLQEAGTHCCILTIL